MHIALVHGYWLRGTGSNIYVRNLARELVQAGHRVSLFCQEDAPEEVDYVARRVDFHPDNTGSETRWDRPVPYSGRCDLYRPHLGGLLPVYVYDEYPGYQVKTLQDMGREEIESYLERNRRALASVLEEDPAELVLSQHSVMQPVYAGRALGTKPGRGHLTVVHGSCLHFAVKKSSLVEEYAREAMSRSQSLVFVSDHSRREFLGHFPGVPGLGDKARVIPAGVDVEVFQPLQPGESKARRIRALDEWVRSGPWGLAGRTARDREDLAARVVAGPRELGPVLDKDAAAMPNLAPDRDAGERLLTLPVGDAPWLLYFGKYLWTKGLHLLVAAAPLVWARHPDAAIVLVGFGGLRPYLEALVASMDCGDGELFGRLLQEAPGLVPDGGEEMARYFQPLLEALEEDSYAREYFRAARGRAATQLVLTGYMDHKGLQQLLPCTDLAVLPSLFPEAFGLVAVEALSAGVLPLVADHSGLGEVWRCCRRELAYELETGGLDSWVDGLALEPELVFTLARRIDGFLEAWRALAPTKRGQIRQRAHQVALEHFSWSRVARELLDLGKPGGRER